MPLIHLETYIEAAPRIVFDLSRSIDLHKHSMKHCQEEVVEGKSTGLMVQGEVVTWSALHLFKNRQLTVKLTKANAPASFTDEMLQGDFTQMRHDHFFNPHRGGTIMIDDFYFQTPFGMLGKLAEGLFLKTYMTRLLIDRNKAIKQAAETDLWKLYITA